MGRSEVAKERQRKRNNYRYYSTIIGLNDARALAQQLGKQHRDAVNRLFRLQTTTLRTDRRVLDEYVAASALVEQLREEKQRLMGLVEAREKLQHQLTTTFDHFVARSNATYSLMRFQLETPDAPVVSLRPMAKDECAAIVDAFYGDVRRYLETWPSTTSQKTVFGWSDLRQVNGSIEKIVVGHTPLELVTRSWDVQASPLESTRIYSPSLNSTMQCLQQVDDNNMVFYERFRPEGSSVSYYSLFLGSRFEVEDGYVEILVPVDRSRLIRPVGNTDHDSDRWVEMRIWILYQKCEGQENQCRITLGGSIECLTKEDTHMWMTEMLFMSMRWENKLVGPRFYLTMGNNPKRRPDDATDPESRRRLRSNVVSRQREEEAGPMQQDGLAVVDGNLGEGSRLDNRNEFF